MGNNKEDKELKKDKIESYFDEVANRHKDLNSVLDVSDSDQARHSNIYRDYFTKHYIKENILPQPADYILDFGCGVGRVTNYLAPYVNEITGVDLSAEMIKVTAMNKKGRNVNFHHLKTVPFPFKENTFDKIFTNWVFQHISEEDAINYLIEFKRILKPGGRIFLFEQTKNETVVSKNHNHIYRREEEYNSLFISAGIDVISSKHVMRVPSRGMSLWNKKIMVSPLWLYTLRMIDKSTISRKPHFADYFTSLFIAGK